MRKIGNGSSGKQKEALWLPDCSVDDGGMHLLNDKVCYQPLVLLRVLSHQRHRRVIHLGGKTSIYIMIIMIIMIITIIVTSSLLSSAAASSISSSSSLPTSSSSAVAASSPTSPPSSSSSSSSSSPVAAPSSSSSSKAHFDNGSEMDYPPVTLLINCIHVIF